jgi:hypothetical protein
MTAKSGKVNSLVVICEQDYNDKIVDFLTYNDITMASNNLNNIFKKCECINSKKCSCI